MEDEDDYLDDVVADTAEDMPEGCGHFASIDHSNKPGQNPQLYKGKLSTFLKVRPEGLSFVLLLSLFSCSFICTLEVP